MKKGANSTYFGNLSEGIKTLIKGLRLSIRHFKNARKSVPKVSVIDDTYFSESTGTVTLQYPAETIAVPDNGRYRLFNEMDDCIVCDKCAKVCPVDCIEIEPIKSAELIGNASDGSPIRLYAAKFDIDMAKCCFCGLCTTVCPTECLTMTKTYDFAEFDVKDFNYHYANLTPEQAEQKKSNYLQYVAEKEALKIENPKQENIVSAAPKAVFKPTFKKIEVANNIEIANELPSNLTENKPKPAFKPVFKRPEIETDTQKKEKSKPESSSIANTDTVNNSIIEGDIQKPRATFKPTFKPK